MEINAYLRLMDRIAAEPAHASDLPHCKGLFFVYLYGAYEFTINEGVRALNASITASGVALSDCKPALLSLALDAELKSFAQAIGGPKWRLRHKLFERLGTADTVNIGATLNPTAGRNVDIEQLRLLFTSFAISNPLFPRPEIEFRISELVRNRVDVAHGNQSAAQVGGRYTLAELGERFRDIDELCTYLIDTFQNYLLSRSYRAV